MGMKQTILDKIQQWVHFITPGSIGQFFRRSILRIGLKKTIEKVNDHITLPKGQPLVLKHMGFPEAGVQVPGGKV